MRNSRGSMAEMSMDPIRSQPRKKLDLFFIYGFDHKLLYTFMTCIKSTLSRNLGPLFQLTCQFTTF